MLKSKTLSFVFCFQRTKERVLQRNSKCLSKSPEKYRMQRGQIFLCQFKALGKAFAELETALALSSTQRILERFWRSKIL